MNNLHMRPEVLKRIREQYPIGCTVEIIEMCDPYRDMPAGLRGTVTHVDDTGTVFADWENGSTLGAVFGRGQDSESKLITATALRTCMFQ